MNTEYVFFFILCCCVIVVLYTIDRSEYRTAHIWLLLVLCNAFFCLMLDGYDIDRIKSRILNVRTNCLLWNYNVILKKRSGKFAHTCKTENNVSSSKCTSNVCKRWNTQDFWAKNTPYSYLACEAVHEVLNDAIGCGLWCIYIWRSDNMTETNGEIGTMCAHAHFGS